MRLTDISVRQLPHTQTGQKRIRDDLVPGFGVTVGTRTKTFFVMQGRDRRLTTIGKFGDISLADARSEAKRLLAYPSPKRSLQTLSEARASYLEECETRTRPKTLIGYRHYLHQLDDKKLADIKRGDIDINHPQTLAAWKTFMNWCVRSELIDSNPFLHQKARYGVRDRILSPAELKAVWEYDYLPFSNIVKLLILTGQRRSQWGAFDPSWIDGDTITFPADQMKGKQSHTIPLTPLVAETLPNEPVTFNSWSKSKKRMDKHTGVTDYTLHDLRRTTATMMIEIGITVPTVEALLAHRSGTISGVAAIYIRHSFLKEMRAAMEAFEAHLQSDILAPPG